MGESRGPRQPASTDTPAHPDRRPDPGPGREPGTYPDRHPDPGPGHEPGAHPGHRSSAGSASSPAAAGNATGGEVSPPGRARPLGSALHLLTVALAAIVFSVVATLARPLPHRWRFLLVSGWARFSLACLRLLCGVRIVVEGREHLPAGPAVIACKHQSALETLALQGIFPAHAWVLKRELLFIPFFGWGLASLEPIAIDRSAQRQALKQVLAQGLERLRRGIWVLIFPEGTRMPPGVAGRYAQSAAALALRAGCPIVPVAHNAGLCWPRRGWLRHAGTVTFRIGPPIDPTGRNAAELTAAIEGWVESQARALLPPGPSRAGSSDRE